MSHLPGNDAGSPNDSHCDAVQAVLGLIARAVIPGSLSVFKMKSSFYVFLPTLQHTKKHLLLEIYTGRDWQQAVIVSNVAQLRAAVFMLTKPKQWEVICHGL